MQTNHKSDVMEALEGELLAQKIYPDGTKETVFHQKNLIMLVSKQKFLAVAYAASGNWDPITTLHVGIGGTLDPQGLFPKAVNHSLDSLYADILAIPTHYDVNDNIPSVTFITDLDQGMGNGQKITEAGLFTSTGRMFNIKCFPGIDKTSEFNLHFEWTIKIS